MSLSAKHYELIAEAIADAQQHANSATSPSDYLFGARMVALKLIDGLARDNPRFDRARFLSACGITP